MGVKLQILLKEIITCNHLEDLAIAIAYNSVYRAYYWITPKNETSFQFITHCPSCGKKWPKHLIKEYFDELEKIIKNHIIYADLDLNNLPEEFNSEQWWRKRGF